MIMQNILVFDSTWEVITVSEIVLADFLKLCSIDHVQIKRAAVSGRPKNYSRRIR